MSELNEPGTPEAEPASEPEVVAFDEREPVSREIFEQFHVNVADVDPPAAQQALTVLILTDRAGHAREYVFARETARKLGARMAGTAVTTATPDQMAKTIAQQQAHGKIVGR